MTYKIYELRRRRLRQNSIFSVYEVFDAAGNKLAFGEYARNYLACMVTTGNGFGIAELTGDPKALKDPGPGAAVAFAFMRDVPAANVPEWIRPAFIDWLASLETPDDTDADRVKFNREDGLYYAIVGGREFGGWQTRRLAEGGLLIEQKRAAEHKQSAVQTADRILSDAAERVSARLESSSDPAEWSYPDAALKNEIKRRGLGKPRSAERFLKEMDPGREWKPETVAAIDKLLNTLTVDLYFAAGFQAYLSEETPAGSDFDRGSVERARRRSVMKIDEITRSALRQLDSDRDAGSDVTDPL